MSHDQPIYSIIIIISREGKTDFYPFRPGEEKEAEEFWEKASAQWSDSFFCRVEHGPFV